NTTSEAWKFKHLKRKTDRDDAQRLAEVYRLGQFPTVVVPTKEVREKRGLIETRQRLVGRRVALQNRIRSILVGQGLPAPSGAKAWTAIGLAGITQHAQPITDCAALELWRGRPHLAPPEPQHGPAPPAPAGEKNDSLAPGNQSLQVVATNSCAGPRTPRANLGFPPGAGRARPHKHVSG